MTWIQPAVNYGAPEILKTGQVHVEDSKARSEAPDMLKGDEGEFTAPTECQGKATDDGQDHVTDGFSSRETLVGQGPNAVHAMGAFWFTNGIFKQSLKKKFFLGICLF